MYESSQTTDSYATLADNVEKYTGAPLAEHLIGVHRVQLINTKNVSVVAVLPLGKEASLETDHKYEVTVTIDKKPITRKFDFPSEVDNFLQHAL
jgi:hypothetical protein